MRGSGLAAITAPGEWELNQRPGERPIVPGCNGNCEILLRESNCMCSSSGFPLCHRWSQWRLGKIETRYLLSHIRMNRQLPEIGFHFDVRGSVAYNCHGILLFDPFPSPIPLTLLFLRLFAFLSASLSPGVSFLRAFICPSVPPVSLRLALWWNHTAESQPYSGVFLSFPVIACIAKLCCGYLEETSGGSGEKDVGGQRWEKVFQLD